jgi:hypothetical protein
MDEFESAINPFLLGRCAHSREASWLLMGAILRARYVLIQGDRHALPTSRQLPY